MVSRLNIIRLRHTRHQAEETKVVHRETKITAVWLIPAVSTDELLTVTTKFTTRSFSSSNNRVVSRK